MALAILVVVAVAVLALLLRRAEAVRAAPLASVEAAKPDRGGVGREGSRGLRPAAVTLGGCTIDLRADEYTVRDRREFTVSPGGETVVDLSTYDGSVAVRGWDRPAVVVEIERAGFLPETEAGNCYFAPSISSVLPTDPAPYGQMTTSNWTIATSPQRFDAPRPKTNPSPRKSKTAGPIFWKNSTS